MSQTRVVNRHTHRYDVYVGRGSILGNPFRVRPLLGRKLAIALYREMFLYQVEHNKEFRRAVLACRGKALGCSCKPKPCHADVIVEWLNSH